MRNLSCLLFAILLAACAAESAPTATPALEEPEPTAVPAATATEEEVAVEQLDFKLTSSAYLQGDPIPANLSCDGENTSPRLTWTNPPEGTKSFALIFDDPDAPGGTWVHWVLFNLPSEARSLPANVPPDRHAERTERFMGRIAGIPLATADRARPAVSIAIS